MDPMALLLVALASVFLGTFGLGMKYIAPLAWEAWWLVYSVVAMIVFPVAWALFVVPDLWESIASSPRSAMWAATILGFLWGIGGLTFGVSVRYVGVSITYGVVMGLSGSLGSVIPLVRAPEWPGLLTLVLYAVGLVIVLIGVAVAAYAGVCRERLQGAGRQASGVEGGRPFRVGLLIAITSGVLSSLLNVGFAEAAPVAARAQELGATQVNASLASWVVVLFGALVLNAGYCVVLLTKNRNWSSFRVQGAGKACVWAVFTGLIWFATFGVYGLGAARMGDLGSVIGWPILLGLGLIISNGWALVTGEWKGARRPLKTMAVAVGIIILGCVVLGYAKRPVPAAAARAPSSNQMVWQTPNIEAEVQNLLAHIPARM